jgi:hypothetical protein
MWATFSSGSTGSCSRARAQGGLNLCRIRVPADWSTARARNAESTESRTPPARRSLFASFAKLITFELILTSAPRSTSILTASTRPWSAANMSGV